MTNTRIRLTMVALAASVCFAVLTNAAEKAVLLLQDASKPSPHFQHYGVRTVVYTPEAISKTVGTEFEDDLTRCRVLMVARGGGGAVRMVFRNKSCLAAIHEFLGRGGVIFFDYNSYPAAQDLMKSLDLPHLGWCEKPTHKYYSGRLTDQGMAALAKDPNTISEKAPGGYGGWLEVPESMTVLARMPTDPRASVLLEQRKVAGKGRILFSQLASLMEEKNEFFENFWSYLLGESMKGAGPGVAHGMVDPYRQAVPPFNALYLSRTQESPWWNDQYKKRIPILVAEPIGLRRRAAAVSVLLDRAVNGIALVTHSGESVPFQKIVRADGKTEIVFQTDLLPYGHSLFYLYADGPEIRVGLPGIPGLLVDDSGDVFRIANQAVTAALFKDQAGLASFRLLSGGLGEAVSGWRGIDTGGALTLSGQWGPPQVVEHGPVRLVVEQESEKGGLTVRYALYAGDVPFIAHTVIGKEGQNVSMGGRWSPGGRGDNVDYVYESSDGIRIVRARMEQGMAGFKVDLGDVLPFFKEGWFAVRDSRGEAVGLCFEREQAGKVGMGRRAHLGIPASLYVRLKGGRHNTLAVLARGDWTQVRQVYVAYRNPPVVACAAWQDLSPIVPVKPKPDRDLYRVLYFRSRWMKPYIDSATPEQAREKVRRLVETARRHGADTIRASFGRGRAEATLAAWNEFVELCDRNGIVIFAFAPGKNPMTREEKKYLCRDGRPCPVRDRKAFYLRVYGDAAKASAELGGGDLCHIMDEYSWFHTNETVRALFKKRYGGTLPVSGAKNYGDASDRDYANSLLFRTEIITELARDVSAEIKKHLPDQVVSSVVNIKGLNRPYRLSDMEEHSRYLDMGGVDLYSALTYYRKALMFARGAYGNTKRIENCIGYRGGKALRQQMDLSTMYGASMLFFGGADFYQLSPQRTTDVVGPYYLWLKFSGLAGIMSGMKPVRHTALLRDRNLLFETIRNLELPKDKSTFTVERGLYALADLNNIQMDMAFSRFFNIEALEGYRVLLVPNDKYLPAEFGQTIREFVGRGGCAYVEGESCRANPAMKDICRDGEQIAVVADMPIFKRVFEKGCVLYAEAFLSEKLPHNPALKCAFKALILKHGGTGPVSVDSAGEKDLDNMLYADGKRYLLIVRNSSPFLDHEASFTLSAAVAKPATWVDMRTGERGEFTGTLSCSVMPESTRFFLISPSAALAWPETTLVDQDAGCYSRDTGMTFLNISPRDDGDSDAKHPKVRGMINVGVFVHPKMAKIKPEELKGQLGIEKELEKSYPGIVATAVEDMAPETLDSFDVMVMPNIRKATPPGGWEKNLREYVIAGGRALLLHHAVGSGSISRVMFPEVGQGVEHVPELEMHVVSDHPVITGQSLKNGVPGLKSGMRFKSGFPDFISLVKGDAGELIMKSVRGRTEKPENVMVIGKVGEGKVVLCGMNIGCQHVTRDGKTEFLAEVTDGGEREILLNAIRWLAK